MKAAYPLIAAALSLAACGGSAGAPSYSRASYGASPFDSAPAPANGDTRQARLTPPSKVSLDTLPGMSGTALTSALGAPQFRRLDGTAEIWQYRGTACTLDVFLYAEGGNLKVRYVEEIGRAHV